MNLLVFLTHNFNNEFLNTLSKVDSLFTDLTAIVLCDSSADIPAINLKNIAILPTDKCKTSYDRLGHSMVINYFRTNRDSIDKYKYIWIVENDVYYPNSFKQFIDRYNDYEYDLLVPEYGLRAKGWMWTASLTGFTNTSSIGVLAVVLRFSSRLLAHLVDNIDKNYSGYFEAILPHICLEYGFSLQQFFPEMCGVLTTDNGHPMLRFLKMDIINKTRNFIQDKIYHPIKL